MLSPQNREELALLGYTIVPGVLDDDQVDYAKAEFYKWMPPAFAIEGPKSQRINSHHAGHTNAAWFIRTNPKVLAVYRALENTNDLVVSFQGCGWNPMKIQTAEDPQVLQCDEGPNQNYSNTYQSLVSLTNNSQSTIGFIPG